VLTFDLNCGDVLALGVLDRPSVILLRVSNEQPEEANRRLSVVLGEQHAAMPSLWPRESKARSPFLALLPSIDHRWITDQHQGFAQEGVGDVQDF
jgi:hypothetical protein